MKTQQHYVVFPRQMHLRYLRCSDRLLLVWRKRTQWRHSAQVCKLSARENGHPSPLALLTTSYGPWYIRFPVCSLCYSCLSLKWNFCRCVWFGYKNKTIHMVEPKFREPEDAAEPLQPCGCVRPLSGAGRPWMNTQLPGCCWRPTSASDYHSASWYSNDVFCEPCKHWVQHHSLELLVPGSASGNISFGPTETATNQSHSMTGAYQV